MRGELNKVFDAQAVNNVTPAPASSSIAIEPFHEALVYYTITASGTPGGLTLDVEFDNGEGTFFHYDDPDWKLLTFNTSDTPVTRCLPIKRVIGKNMRLQATGTSVSGVNFFTINAWIELVKRTT